MVAVKAAVTVNVSKRDDVVDNTTTTRHCHCHVKEAHNAGNNSSESFCVHCDVL
jgi:hypothetical protein